jgi:deazaflavin-dependent oxidoreductase (nitroreductase family)
LGSRFLLLEHQGRTTGKLRRAVLEIITADPQAGRYGVVSGFGSRSHWYQNILANPDVTIQIGRKRFQALAEQLGPGQASQTLVDYWKKHPGSLAALGKFMGYKIELSEEGVREFGQRIPIIQFTRKE